MYNTILNPKLALCAPGKSHIVGTSAVGQGQVSIECSLHQIFLYKSWNSNPVLDKHPETSHSSN